MPDDLTTTPDRALMDAIFYADHDLAQHLEIDCEGGGEFECPTCTANRETIRLARTEIERRALLGIAVEDPNEPTLEQRLEPYGIEWELEQRERYGR
jgi:hypothetical protein